MLVPCFYLATLASTLAATFLAGIDSSLLLRCLGIGALLAWIGVTLGGTVPINAAALTWDASAPPADWRTQVDHWERLNSVRTWAAVIAFASLLAGLPLMATKG